MAFFRVDATAESVERQALLEVLSLDGAALATLFVAREGAAREYRFSSKAVVLLAATRTASDRSYPEVFEPLGVAPFGFAATDAEHVQAVRPGFE